jgi:hypothetical protein
MKLTQDCIKLLDFEAAVLNLRVLTSESLGIVVAIIIIIPSLNRTEVRCPFSKVKQPTFFSQSHQIRYARGVSSSPLKAFMP